MLLVVCSLLKQTDLQGRAAKRLKSSESGPEDGEASGAAPSCGDPTLPSAPPTDPASVLTPVDGQESPPAVGESDSYQAGLVGLVLTFTRAPDKLLVKSYRTVLEAKHSVFGFLKMPVDYQLFLTREGRVLADADILVRDSLTRGEVLVYSSYHTTFAPIQTQVQPMPRLHSAPF